MGNSDIILTRSLPHGQSRTSVPSHIPRAAALAKALSRLFVVAYFLLNILITIIYTCIHSLCRGKSNEPRASHFLCGLPVTTQGNQSPHCAVTPEPIAATAIAAAQAGAAIVPIHVRDPDNGLFQHGTAALPGRW